MPQAHLLRWTAWGQFYSGPCCFPHLYPGAWGPRVLLSLSPLGYLSFPPPFLQTEFLLRDPRNTYTLYFPNPQQPVDSSPREGRGVRFL